MSHGRDGKIHIKVKCEGCGEKNQIETNLNRINDKYYEEFVFVCKSCGKENSIDLSSITKELTKVYNDVSKETRKIFESDRDKVFKKKCLKNGDLIYRIEKYLELSNYENIIKSYLEKGHTSKKEIIKEYKNALSKARKRIKKCFKCKDIMQCILHSVIWGAPSYNRIFSIVSDVEEMMNILERQLRESLNRYLVVVDEQR